MLNQTRRSSARNRTAGDTPSEKPQAFATPAARVDRRRVTAEPEKIKLTPVLALQESQMKQAIRRVEDLYKDGSSFREYLQ